MLARRCALVFALGGVFACGAPAPVCPVLPSAPSVSAPPAVEALPPAPVRFLPTMVVADEEGVIVTTEGLPFLEEPTSPAFLGLAAAVEEALADRGIGRAVDFAGELSVRETTVREPIRPLPPPPPGRSCMDLAESAAMLMQCHLTLFDKWAVSAKGTTTTRTDAARPGDYLAYPRFWGRCLEDRSVPRSPRPGGISLRIERRFVAVAKGNFPEIAWRTTGPASEWARILVTREVLRKGQPLPPEPVEDPAGGPLFRSPLAALVGVHCGR